MSCNKFNDTAEMKDALVSAGGQLDAISCVYYQPLGESLTLMLITFVVGFALVAYNRGIAAVVAIGFMMGPAILPQLPGVAISLAATIFSLSGLVMGGAAYIWLERKTF